MHVLVTGHTGFKGSWLALLLTQRGFSVSGLALDPVPGALFAAADVGELLTHDLRCDIRDSDATVQAIGEVAPDLVVHLAAQPLVRASYADPRYTMETNVMGTLSVLEGVRATPSVQAAVMVTTDKVYRNVEQIAGYVEDDALGGRDPYSASKAMADILIASWASSYGGPAMGIARAGNVIGGGDVGVDRLMPDIARALLAGEAVALRNPSAVRPWQHVLDCLSGYLLLADALIAGTGEGAWNFGPEPSSFRTVQETAEYAQQWWGSKSGWITDDAIHPHEAGLLTLDATRARNELRWRDELDYQEAIAWTLDWTRRVQGGEAAFDVCMSQIKAFEQRRGAVS
jgi:CDP-glucose 4,6-dehydratase